MSQDEYQNDLTNRIRAWMDKSGWPEDIASDDVIRGLGRLDLVGHKPSQMAVGKVMSQLGYERFRRAPGADGRRPWAYRPIKRARL